MLPPDERTPAAAIPAASDVGGIEEDQGAICGELIGERYFCEWHE
jgi:hypothetical protein